MKKKLTKDLYVALMQVSLEEIGYETEVDGDGYIRAYSNINKDDLLIFVVGRCLSNKKAKETTMISAEDKAITKVERRAEDMSGNFVACVGFGIGKYGYSDSEICIVPISIWEESQRGTMFSFTGEKYYYNYDKMPEFLPEGVIVRSIWKAVNCK